MKNKVWNIDRDKDNCYHRNLIWVNNEEYIDLQREIMLIEELGIPDVESGMPFFTDLLVDYA